MSNNKKSENLKNSWGQFIKFVLSNNIYTYMSLFSNEYHPFLICCYNPIIILKNRTEFLIDKQYYILCLA